MDNELLEKIKAQDEKIDKILESVEKTRKYFLWTFWITVILFVLPLIALIFVIPWFLSMYLGSFDLGSANSEQMLEGIEMLQGL